MTNRNRVKLQQFAFEHNAEVEDIKLILGRRGYAGTEVATEYEREVSTGKFMRVRVSKSKVVVCFDIALDNITDDTFTWAFECGIEAQIILQEVSEECHGE